MAGMARKPYGYWRDIKNARKEMESLAVRKTVRNGQIVLEKLNVVPAAAWRTGRPVVNSICTALKDYHKTSYAKLAHEMGFITKAELEEREKEEADRIAVIAYVKKRGILPSSRQKDAMLKNTWFRVRRRAGLQSKSLEEYLGFERLPPRMELASGSYTPDVLRKNRRKILGVLARVENPVHRRILERRVFNVGATLEKLGAERGMSRQGVLDMMLNNMRKLGPHFEKAGLNPQAVFRTGMRKAGNRGNRNATPAKSAHY